MSIREKTKGQQLKGKIVSALFQTFSHFFRILPPGLFLKLRPFKEEQKEKDQTIYCTLVVACLSSSKSNLAVVPGSCATITPGYRKEVMRSCSRFIGYADQLPTTFNQGKHPNSVAKTL